MSHVSNELRNRLIELIDQLHDSVWAEACKAGGDAMREAILRAAQAPNPPTAELPLPTHEREVHASRESAGRVDEHRSELRRLGLKHFASAPSAMEVLAAPSEASTGFALQSEITAEIARQKVQEKHAG